MNRGIGACAPTRDLYWQEQMFRWFKSIRVLYRSVVCPDDQINIFHAALRKNTFAYLPGKPKLFNMKAGEREKERERVAGDVLGEEKKEGGGW